MKTLFVVWQDPEERNWHPVARLDEENGSYIFRYTRGATLSKNFRPFGRLKDLEKIYRSNELYPFFKNRIMQRNRPEFRDYVHWLDLDFENLNPMEILSRTGGERRTDKLAIIPCPTPNENGEYVCWFFSHGIRYLSESARDCVDRLQRGDRLYLLLDVQNPYDSHAVALRPDEPAMIVGYCPRYWARDVRFLLQGSDPRLTKVAVERVNPKAPLQLRLLCRLQAPWPEGFRACATPEFETLEQNSSDYS